MGRWSSGVAQVLSHTTRAPAACPTRQIAAMSVTASAGLEGVSTQSSRVRGVRARSTVPGSVMSTKLLASPQRANTSRSTFAVP